MKTIFKISITAIGLLFSFAAQAAYDDVATIRSVEPIHSDQVQQQQVCDGMQGSNQVQNSGNSYTGSVLGGIAGALLGSGVGGGSGRLVATAIGAAAGAMTGDRIDNRQGNFNNQPSCRIVQTVVSRISAYLVTYDYNGRTYQSSMQRDPSQGGNTTVRVSVAVTAN